MRSLGYKDRYIRLLQPDIVSLVSQIHEQKVRQIFATETKADSFAQLAERAKIKSIKASNQMEGIDTSDSRLKKIVCDKTVPKTCSEKEIAGYREALNGICQNYAYMPVKPSTILQLHQELYKFTGNKGGYFRSPDDAVVAQTGRQDSEAAGGRPAAAGEVAEYINAICQDFQDTCRDPLYDPLLVIPMFILDFLCVHPFYAGNRRISRLLTLLLLYRSEYTVGMYSSIEKLIEKTKGSYEKTLRDSALGWHEGSNHDLPFVRYMLKIIIAAYRDFSSVQFTITSGMPKPERVREIIRNSSKKITRADIMKKCPDISRVTVERALTEMVKNQEILKIGGGRYTAYTWNREKE